jgi:hypothetical protein
MTVSVANVASATDTFSQWLTKTNQIADALTTKVVTTDSNTATGNAAISGSFSSGNVYTNFLAGGNNTSLANLTVSTNTFFSANASFTGYKIKLGLGANVQIDSGNSTYRVLTINSSGNTLVATKIGFADVQEMYVTGATNTHVLAFNSANSTWYNKVGLLVYYANGDIAYP